MMPNFISSISMLLLLGVLGIRSRNLIGYTAMHLFAHALLLPALAAVLMITSSYNPPVVP